MLALQRLAEQTAELHRRFLEGQEKTQQTFLKLLEHQQRLSLAVVDSSEPTSPVRPSSSSVPFKPPLPLDPPDRVHEKEPRVATLPQPSAAIDAIASTLIEVVAQKTGYPAEVLDLDMQLDADLGIDSIKRVEILSALQDRLSDLPPFQPEQLGSFRSLRTILEYIGQAKETDGLGTKPAARTLNAAPDRTDFLARALLDAVAEKTGYPVEMLELDMRLDADLGIDSIKRVEIFSAIQDKYPETPRAGPEEIGTLGTLREIVVFLGRTAVEPQAAEIKVQSNGVCAPNGSANNDRDRPDLTGSSRGEDGIPRRYA